jgi:hypothetical protein
MLFKKEAKVINTQISENKQKFIPHLCHGQEAIEGKLLTFMKDDIKFPPSLATVIG